MKRYPSNCTTCKVKLPPGRTSFYCRTCEADYRRKRTARLVGSSRPQKTDPEAIALLDAATAQWGRRAHD